MKYLIAITILSLIQHPNVIAGQGYTTDAFARIKTLRITNGNIVGVLFNLDYPHRAISFDEQIAFTFCTINNSNRSISVWLPTSQEYLYRMDLYDQNMNALPKTKIGENIGRMYHKMPKNMITNVVYKYFKSEADLKPIEIYNDGGPLVKIMSPKDVVLKPKAGKYKLMLELQLYISQPKGKGYVMQLRRLSPIEVEIEIP